MDLLKTTFLLALMVFGYHYGYCQEKGRVRRVMFYNVENFFDPFDDSLTRDEEFTPAGVRRWTYARFMDKAVRIARVIIACGGPDPPFIVGLAEIENQFVLKKLCYDTPLRNIGYRFVHVDSPDPRGIDVAILYRPELARLDTFFVLPMEFSETSRRSRDVLFARFIVDISDTLLISVNHWPSRYGGAAASNEYRIGAARQLKEFLSEGTPSLCQGPLIVMGDFNDEPCDESMRILSGITEMDSPDGCKIINLMPGDSKAHSPGTIKHEGYWSCFDQILVSWPLFEGNGGMVVLNKKAVVFTTAFLLEADNSHLGEKPFRGYIGPAYHGGFSDHLPVYVDLRIP